MTGSCSFRRPAACAHGQRGLCCWRGARGAWLTRAAVPTCLPASPAGAPGDARHAQVGSWGAGAVRACPAAGRQQAAALGSAFDPYNGRRADPAPCAPSTQGPPEQLARLSFRKNYYIPNHHRGGGGPLPAARPLWLHWREVSHRQGGPRAGREGLGQAGRAWSRQGGPGALREGLVRAWGRQ